jgi:hypothetical protein
MKAWKSARTMRQHFRRSPQGEEMNEFISESNRYSHKSATAYDINSAMYSNGVRHQISAQQQILRKNHTVIEYRQSFFAYRQYIYLDKSYHRLTFLIISVNRLK